MYCTRLIDFLYRAIIFSLSHILFRPFFHISGLIFNCTITPDQSLDIPSCVHQNGSHEATLWIYFLTRMVWNWFMLSCFSLYDSTSVRMADEHGSSYSSVLLWHQIAGTLAPFFSGYMIREPDPQTKGKHIFLAEWFKKNPQDQISSQPRTISPSAFTVRMSFFSSVCCCSSSNSRSGVPKFICDTNTAI